MQRHITQKAGASNNARPAVWTAFTATGNAGSHSVAASKISALFDVLGHSMARFPDGSTVQITPDALKIITPVHGAFNA